MSDPVIVLPIYFVADTSESMTPVIGEVNTGLSSLLSAMQLEPMASSRIRFSVLGFSRYVQWYLEPTDLRRVDYMPFLRATGTTFYSAAFDALYQRIPLHVERLRRERRLVTRPSVFFLTDGRPMDPEPVWRAALERLQSDTFPLHPNILAFGVGPEADPNIVRAVATNDSYALVTEDGKDIGASLARFAESLTHSVVASGQALASGSSDLPVMRPDGFILAIDILE